MRLILARHGQTSGDVEDRYGGAYDDILSSEGREQAVTLSTELAGKGIEAVYSSDLMRARQTAGVLAERLGREVEVVPALRERNQYGRLTGMTKAEAKEKFPDEVALVKDRLNTLAGAESYADAAARMKAAFAQIAANEPGCAAVIWHGGGMRVLFREILGLGELSEIGDCCWVELERKGDGWRVVEMRRIEVAA